MPTITATNIQNDGNPLGTQVLESTPLGDSISAVTAKNDGTLMLGNATHPGSISSDNGAFHTDGSGNVTAHNITATGTLSVSTNTTFSGSISVNGSPTPQYKIGTFAMTSVTSITVNHGLGTTPSWVGVVCTTATPVQGSVTNITSTQFTYTFVTGTASGTFSYIVMA